MSSHIGKVFEKILKNRLKTFVMNNNLIDHEQECFLPKKSTTRSLYRLKIGYELLTRDKKKADFINLDLEKAFDSVGTMNCCSNCGQRNQGTSLQTTQQVSHSPRCENKT